MHLLQHSKDLTPLKGCKLFNFYMYVVFVDFHSSKCVLCTDAATMLVHKQLWSSRFVLVYYKYERILNGGFPVVPESPQAEDTGITYAIF